MMNEDEAREWVRTSFDVSHETMARLDGFVAFLREETTRQNLVSRASVESVWLRHIADSAQLLTWRPRAEASWIDLGSGAGFPGLIVAALHGGPVTLVEERRLRVDFLTRAAELLGLGPRLRIEATKVERVPPRPYEVISARAFAPLDRLLDLATAFSTEKTRWILPKGRNAQVELEAIISSWQGDFRLEPSLTDADARLIVADGVRRKARKGKRG
jgi:16S rRNA (guanine527-N7)-methyltransferase